VVDAAKSSSKVEKTMRIELPKSDECKMLSMTWSDEVIRRILLVCVWLTVNHEIQNETRITYAF